MRFLIPVLAFAVLVFASSEISGTSSGSGFVFPETDDVIDTYAYDPDTVCSTIPASFNDYRVVDDFLHDQPVSIGSFTYWGVSTASAPSELELMYFEDNAGVPGDEVFQTSYSVSSQATGYTYGMYSVYVAVMTLPTSLFIPANTTAWLGFHRVGDNWYTALGPAVVGSEAYRTQGAGYNWVPVSSNPDIGAADLFKIIEGTVSLERSTWAGIKHLF